MEKLNFLKTYLKNVSNKNSRDKVAFLLEHKNDYFVLENNQYTMKPELKEEIKSITKTISSFVVKQSPESYFSGAILNHEQIYSLKKNFIDAIRENESIYLKYPSIRNFLVENIEKGNNEQLSAFYQNVNHYRESAIVEWKLVSQNSGTPAMKNMANNMVEFYETEPYNSLVPYLYNSFLNGHDLFTSSLTNEYQLNQTNLDKNISVSDAIEFIQTMHNLHVSIKTGIMFHRHFCLEELSDEDLRKLEAKSSSYLKDIQNTNPEKIAPNKHADKYLLTKGYIDQLKSYSLMPKYLSKPVITTMEKNSEKIVEYYTIYKDELSFDYLVKEVSINLNNPKCFNVQLSIVPFGENNLKTTIARIDQGYTSGGNELGRHTNMNYSDPLSTSLHIHDFNEMTELMIAYNKGKLDVNTNFNTDIRINFTEAEAMICDMYGMNFDCESVLSKDSGIDRCINKILDKKITTNEEINQHINQSMFEIELKNCFVVENLNDTNIQLKDTNSTNGSNASGADM